MSLSEADSILLFTAARELLFNVVKHSGVRRATLELADGAGGVVLRVSDRGCGFDPQRWRSQRPQGFGLFSIRERVESLGGVFALNSRPGRGVRVTVKLPLREDAMPAPTGKAKP